MPFVHLWTAGLINFRPHCLKKGKTSLLLKNYSGAGKCTTDYLSELKGLLWWEHLVQHTVQICGCCQSSLSNIDRIHLSNSEDGYVLGKMLPFSCIRPQTFTYYMRGQERYRRVRFFVVLLKEKASDHKTRSRCGHKASRQT